MKQIVYVASSESKQIHVWHLNKEGFLNLVQVVNVPGQIQPMIISNNKRFLYVGVRPNFRLLTYYIALDSGKISLIGELILPGNSNYISIDHKEKFLFSTSYHSGCVSVIYLKDNIPSKILDTVGKIEGCHSANISPDNSKLWVLATKEDKIILFTLSNYGKLLNPYKIKINNKTGPRHMVFHQNKKYAYVINEIKGSIDVWQLNNTCRKIKLIQTIDTMPSNSSSVRWASDIHITPNCKFLYSCERLTSLITIFSISEDGSLLRIIDFQHTETQPRSFNIDNIGKYLIVAGQKSHHISVYEIHDKKGLLKKIGRYAVGQDPIWIVINFN